MLDGDVTDSVEGHSFTHSLQVNDIFSCSWGPDDDGKTVDGPLTLARRALVTGVMTGRHGYGSIYVVASGNGGGIDNCNYDGYANSIYTLTIGAIQEDNGLPYYAERCAAMHAVTYSSGKNGKAITTTDWMRNGDPNSCTSSHSGTSAAAPLAAGLVALMLQLRPCLTWRDVQHVIVLTSVKTYMPVFPA
jgi:proprotein convertase subtilisin/kexin type 7